MNNQQQSSAILMDLAIIAATMLFLQWILLGNNLDNPNHLLTFFYWIVKVSKLKFRVGELDNKLIDRERRRRGREEVGLIKHIV